MKTKLTAMAIFITFALASSQAMANAADDVYIGIQYAHGIYSEEDVPDYNPGVLVGRLGAFGTANFAIEGRAGIGLTDDTNNVLGVDMTLELDYLLGAYAAGHLNFGRSSSIYGLLGFTKIEGTSSGPSASGVSVTADTSDISYGIGADIGITKSIAVNLEYMSYISESAFDVSAGALGLTFKF